MPDSSASSDAETGTPHGTPQAKPIASSRDFDATDEDHALLTPVRPPPSASILSVTSVASVRSNFSTASFDSPSASLVLVRANETLSELAGQLAELEAARLLDSDPDLRSLTARCCCDVEDCPTRRTRDRIDAQLKMSGGELDMRMIKDRASDTSGWGVTAREPIEIRLSLCARECLSWNLC